MARNKVDVRREQLLDAAVRQVQERGLAATRVADVAAELGVSPALVFCHFDSKERLIAEAFAHAAEHDLDRLARARAKATTCVERLRAVLRLYAPTGKASGWRLWIDGWAMALRDHELRTVLRRLDSRWKEAIAEVIAEGTSAGEFRCDDPAAAAGRITAFMDGLAVQVVVRGNGLSRSTMQEWMCTGWPRPSSALSPPRSPASRRPRDGAVRAAICQKDLPNDSEPSIPTTTQPVSVLRTGPIRKRNTGPAGRTAQRQ